MIIDIIDSLKKIIKPQCELSINSSKANNSSIIIKENQLQQGLEKVEITGFTDKKIYGLTLDIKTKKLGINAQKRVICNYFDSQQPYINRVCDGIIFSEIENQDYIFFCELKSNRLTPSDYLVQYQNSTLFIDYLISILENFYLENYQITRNYIYLLFHTQTKQNSKARNVTQPVILEGVKTKKNPKSGFELDVYGIYREISPFEAQQGAKIKVNINAILDS